MQQLRENSARTRIGRALRSTAAAVLCIAVLSAPNLAHAAHGGGGGHGGGGFHGGGFHGGGFHGGGFHAGGFHGGGFHAGAFHGGGFNHGLHGHVASVHNGFGDGRGGHWYHGWHNGRYGWWLWGPGLAWTYYNQPYASQSWYCSDPAGYYPYVTQCNAGWQSVPAG
ncbi:MAG TPA: hypothetical protein VN849_13670 [Stellaceae bacterium]|nr:hypothetical protein [Stellaceae bacterium]